jgi:hypothetical protein
VKVEYDVGVLLAEFGGAGFNLRNPLPVPVLDGESVAAGEVRAFGFQIGE